MDAIRFDPSIAAEYGLDRRQGGDPSGLFADLLGDQLKKRAEADRPEPAARRRPPGERRQAADSPNAHGRPIRPVIKQPNTIRGEARAVCDQPRIEARPEAQPQGAVPAEGNPAETQAETETGAEPQDQENTDAAPEAVAAIPVQQATTETSSAVAFEASEPEVAVATPEAPADGDTDEAQAGATTPAGAETVPDAAGFTAALAASQAETIASVIGDDATAQAQEALAVTAADLAAPRPTPAAAQTTAPEVAEGTAAVALAPELAPAAPRNADPVRPRTARGEPAVEIKGHQAATTAPQPQPQAAITPAAAMTAPRAMPLDTAEPALGFDGAVDGQAPTIPGWSLHLAQGASSKRPDFIAQLRQHLQDLPAHEQVAVNIQRALREGTGRVSIQLSPAELGRINVKLEIDEDKRVTAAVTVEKPSTLELLQRDMKGLERALHDAGLKMDGNDLSFSLGRQDGKEFSQDLGNSGRQGYGPAETEAEIEPDIAAQAAQVDTASGLVNLEI